RAVEGAAMLISHPITFAAPIVAEERRVPWVSTVLAPASFFSVHDLPVFPPLPLVKHLERIPGASRLLVGLARAASRSLAGPVNRLRAERALPSGGNPFLEGQHSPNMVLALFSRVLADPQRDWPANVRITGVIPYNGPASEQLPHDLQRFLEAGPPPVVFTLGSLAVTAAGNFYQTSVDAARRAGCRAVLLTGPHPGNRPAEPLPDGIIVVEHAAHSRLLPRSAATVHHGGIGTLHQALRAGRPMLVVPYAHDQPDNAFRAARLGVSRTIPPRRYSATRVAGELRTLLDSRSYVDHAASVASTMAAEDGLGAACDAIDVLLHAR